MKYSAFYLSTLVFCAVVAYFQWTGKASALPNAEAASIVELGLVIAGVTGCAVLFYYINSRKQR
ncbi:MAG TPA: hypothetical protein VN611_02495 [Patescibacteria group bacterium]|nr:hypothetical protein [Patescibacteria group bacterium]